MAKRLTMTTNYQYRIAPDFTLDWRGPRENCLFAVNMGMHSHGIAEPQLSLMAWRSARILNRALGREQFDLAPTPALIQWRSQQTGATTRAESTLTSNLKPQSC